MLDKTRTEPSYYQGYIDGLSSFAYWKDGIQHVGTTGTLLVTAQREAREALKKVMDAAAAGIIEE